MPHRGKQVPAPNAAILQHVPRSQPALLPVPLFILIEHVSQHALHEIVQPDIITAQKEPINAIIVINVNYIKSE